MRFWRAVFRRTHTGFRCSRVASVIMSSGGFNVLTCQPCGADTTNLFPAFSVVENKAPMEIVRYSTPTPTGNQVLVRTTYAGMCHSDFHFWEGCLDVGDGKTIPLRPASREKPFTLGHEFEGVIVAVGENVPVGNFDMKKSYAIFPWIGCDQPEECVHCAAGNMNFCTSPKTQRYTDGKSQYGGYASHILVPHYKYLIDYEGAVPEGLGGVYMCSGLTAFSSLECAFLSRNPPKVPEDLVVIGCGGIGFQCLGMAIAMSGPPIVCDISEEKLAEAAKLGCRTFNCNNMDTAEEIRKISKGGVAAVIDCVGSEKTFSFASSIIRVGGKVIIVGLMGGKMECPLPMFAIRCLAVEGTLCGNMRQAKDMFDLLRGGKVPVVPHGFRSIFEVNAAMQDMIAGKYIGRCVLKHDWGARTSQRCELAAAKL
eukprot:TRINITY_DN28527_c0_g1_i1.p1 TRINITY_DN28527_c0_g1~~TRINITY_DN28527_c0_g1_i1.p1  ORF type:complete len:425 (+),score=38.73 TRINITY_DN28527_c0_g1_i1:1-1275(+)